MCLPVGGLVWLQSCSRHGAGVSPCIFTAYVPDGSYSYMTSSASEFLCSLTCPGAPRARVVHSQAEVRPAWREDQRKCLLGCLRTGGVGLQEREGIARAWNRSPTSVGVIILIIHMRHWRLREVKYLLQATEPIGGQVCLTEKLEETPSTLSAGSAWGASPIGRDGPGSVS